MRSSQQVVTQINLSIDQMASLQAPIRDIRANPARAHSHMWDMRGSHFHAQDFASREFYGEASGFTTYLTASWIIGIKRVVSQEALAFRALTCMMMFKRRLLAQKVQEGVALPTDLNNAPLQASPNRYPCNLPLLKQAERIYSDYKIKQRNADP